jgi:cytochrome P450
LQVQEEARRIFVGKEAEPPCKAVAQEMPYTLGVLQETLRIYTPVPLVARKLAEDDEILGHAVAAGTTFFVLMQVSCEHDTS